MGIHHFHRTPSYKVRLSRHYVWILLVLNSLAVVLFVYLSHVYWNTNVATTERNLEAQASGSAALLDSKLSADEEFLRRAGQALTTAPSLSATRQILTRLKNELGTENAATAAIVNANGVPLLQSGVPVLWPLENSAHLGSWAIRQSAFSTGSFFLSRPFPNLRQDHQPWVLAGMSIPGTRQYLIIARSAFLPVLIKNLTASSYAQLVVQLVRHNGLVQAQSPFSPTQSSAWQPWLVRKLHQTPSLTAATGVGPLATISGSPRDLWAAAKLANYPLYVVEGIPLKAVFTDWLHTMLIGLIAFAGLVVISDSAILSIISRLNHTRERYAFTLQLYTVLSEVSRITSTATTEPDCLQSLVSALCAEGFHAAWIGVVDPDHIRVLVTQGPGSDSLRTLPFPTNTNEAAFQSLAVRAVRTREAVYENDLATALTHLGYASFIETYHWASGISIPIERHHGVWGVLSLISDRPHAFDHHILPLANQIGRALQDALERFDLRALEHEIQRKNTLVLTLHHVLGAIGEMALRTLDDATILQQICTLLTENGVFVGVTIGIQDPHGHLKFPYHSGQLPAHPTASAQLAWDSGRYQVDNEYHKTACAENSARSSKADFVIYRNKTPYAVLEVHHQDPHIFDEELVQLGIRLAELTGQILTNAFNEQALKRLHQFYQALAHANERLLYTDAAPALYDAIAQLVMAHTPALGCWIAFAQGHRLSVKTRVFADAQVAAYFDQDILQMALDDPRFPQPTVVSDVLRFKKAIIVNDLAGQDLYPGPRAMRFLSHDGINAVAAFPIEDRESQGLLVVHGTTNLFSQEIVTLLQSLAYNLTAKLKSLRAEEEERAVKAQLAYQATHDALTLIPNRALLESAFDHIGVQQKTQPVPLTLFVGDLDKFKQVNDTYGHSAGDYVLQVIAQRLKNCLRAEDRVYRYGGDEFVILIEAALTPPTIDRLTDCIVHHIQEPVNWNNISLSVGISLGIAIDSEGHKEPRKLFKEADEAVYQAKQQGPNHVCLFHDGSGTAFKGGA
ncbi:hypothetical protein BXT84_03780 [Sulfobacillus thermotolerans]|uniref:GGDEF domain-containing protein n=1 Tax=Sulfobacillus thermotolerans TaxID=338644 RepID=A0ABN5GXU6_9FIRM|nr:hypothetical protein BXT84_03780 [Sulfobacillus thermotolerans]